MKLGLTLIPPVARGMQNRPMDNAHDAQDNGPAPQPLDSAGWPDGSPDQRDAVIERLTAALDLALRELELDLAA